MSAPVQHGRSFRPAPVRPAPIEPVDASGLRQTQELLETRARLAGLCAGRAAVRAEEADRSELLRLAAGLRRAPFRAEPAEQRRLRRRLDARVRDISGGIAVPLLAQLDLRLALPLRRQPVAVRDLAGAVFDPALPAIVAGDAEAARCACEDHLVALLHELRQQPVDAW